MAAAHTEAHKFDFSKCWQSLSILKKAGRLTAVGQRYPGPELDFSSNKALQTLCSLSRRQPVWPPSCCMTPVLRSSCHSTEGLPPRHHLSAAAFLKTHGQGQAHGQVTARVTFRSNCSSPNTTSLLWHRLPEVFPTTLGQKIDGSGWMLRDNMWGNHLQVLEMKEGTV